MTSVQRSNQVLHRCITEAKGYLELAKLAEFCGKSSYVLQQRAMESIQRWSRDTALVDAAYKDWLEREKL